MKLVIENKLKVLKGQKLNIIGRASNLFWIGFGEMVKVPQGKTGFKETSEYGLNVQCMWRLKQNGTILVANMDVYTPKSDTMDIEVFNWEEKGSNLFDLKVQGLSKNLGEVYVVKVEATATGDIKLTFTNNWILEIFVDVSDDNECWRFLKSGDLDSHMMVSAIGVEE